MKTSQFLWLEDLFECTFNLSSLINITPFSIIYNESQEKYTIRTSKWRKYVCFANTLMTGITQYFFVIGLIRRASSGSPDLIFRIAPDFGDAFIFTMFSYVIWARPNQIEALLSSINLEKSGKQKLNKDDDRKSSKCWVYLGSSAFVIIYNIFYLLKFFDRYIQILNKWYPSLPQYEYVFGVIYFDFRATIFLSYSTQPKSIFEMSFAEFFAILFFLTFTFYIEMFIACSFLLCAAGVGIAFRNTVDFNKFLMEESDKLSVLKRLQEFKDGVEAINDVIGPVMFGIAAVCAPTFYIANMVRNFTLWDNQSYFIFLVWGIYFWILVFAAQACYQADEIREWIFACDDGEYEQELFDHFVELSYNPVGIRGVECFTITYSYLGQMLGAVITFVIILLQFTSASGQDWTV